MQASRPVRSVSKPILGPSPARRDDRLPAHLLPAFWPVVAVPAPSLFEG